MSGTRAISTTSRRELSSSVSFFLQGKVLKEIHDILTETLACFLPGRAKDLSATCTCWHLGMLYNIHVHAVPSAEHWHIILELQADGGRVVLYANRHGERSHHSQFPKRTCKFRYADADPPWIAATCRVVTITKQTDSVLKKKNWSSPEHTKLISELNVHSLQFCYHGGPGSTPDHSLWDLVRAKWQGNRFYLRVLITLACPAMLHIHIPLI